MGSRKTAVETIEQRLGQGYASAFRQRRHQLFAPGPGREVGAPERTLVQAGRAGDVPGVRSFGDVLLQKLRRIEPVIGRVLRYADHSEELVLHDPQEIQGPRQLTSGQEVGAEQEPVDEAVAQEPDLLGRVAVRGWADDRSQATRQLAGAVQYERGSERGEPVRFLPGLVYSLDIGGFVEVKLAADQALEDGRPVAVLVDEVQLDGGDPGHPLLLVDVIEHFIVEEEDELDVRELVSFRLSEGAVHHRRCEALVEAAEVADTFDHGFLEHRSSMLRKVRGRTFRSGDSLLFNHPLPLSEIEGVDRKS